MSRSVLKLAQAALGLLVLGLLGLLGACGADHGAPAGQVAARVGKSEISTHQVQFVLQRQPRLATTRRDAPRVVLDSLVEQEIAAQAARQEGIESDPAFVQGLEVAKRELLARLYQERLAAAAARPTTDEVDRYYDAHPALFAERRLYTLQEVVVDAAPQAQEPLRQLVENSRSAAELVSALERSGLRFRSTTSVQAPESVPMSLLSGLAALGEGRSMLVSAGPSARIWTLLKTQEARIDRAKAREAIESFLLNERKRELVSRRMQELRKSAGVVLSPQFASAASAASSPSAD